MAASARRVFHVAAKAHPNPYVELLTLEQRRLGLASMIWVDELARIPIQKGSCLHLHWPHQLYHTKELSETIRRAGATIDFLRSATHQGARVFWTAHNMLPHDTSYRQLDIRFQRSLFRVCKAAFVHCNFARLELLKRGFYDRDVHIVRHPHYADVYGEVPRQADARRSLDLDASAKVLLFFGHMRPYKGIETLIRAFRELGLADVILVIAGRAFDPAYRDSLEKLSAGDQNIRFLCRSFSVSEVRLLFGASDLVVLPFVAALTSGTVILAQSLGRFVIAPGIGCISEMLAAGGGFAYDVSGPCGLIDAIRQALRLDLLALGSVGKAYALSQDWQSAAIEISRRYVDMD